VNIDEMTELVQRSVLSAAAGSALTEEEITHLPALRLGMIWTGGRRLKCRLSLPASSKVRD
jgi:hypothetical protein